MALRKHSGNTLTLTAPYNVSSGGGFKSGTIFAVAAFDALLGAQVEGMVTGVFNLATDGSTFVEGDSVYWVDSTQLATSTSSGNMFIGAVEIGNDPAPSGFVSVRLSAVFESLNVVSGGADGQLLVGKTGLAPAFATVSGDATISNAGALTISSAIRKVATVALSAADIKQLNGTPKALVASPGAGKVIVPEKVVISFTNGTQFANGSAVTVVYHGATTPLTASLLASVINAAAASITALGSLSGATNGQTLLAATGLDLYAVGAEFITGTGTASATAYYSVITL